MGACCCAATLDEHTRYINDRLRAEDMGQQRTNKLLFLGPGGSGKSTIFKQLQWLHGGGFGKEDALMLKEHIYCQITSQMKNAIKHYLLSPQQTNIINNNIRNTSPSQESQPSETPQPVNNDSNNNNNNNNNNNINNNNNKDGTLGMVGAHNVTYSGDEDTTIDDEEHKANYDEISLQNAISIVQNHGDVTIFNDELAEAIQYIWKNEVKIQNAFNDMEAAKNKVLDETTEYFWNEIDRIKDINYIPNEQDIINVRYRTTGVIERKFEIASAKFHIFDVGGQKSERKKWINCFNEVKAVIFVISLSCYNENMYEDLNKNCMVDSLELFHETINNKYFVDTHIILFLNKRDLFAKKITKIPITECPAFQDFIQYKNDQIINSNPNDYDQTTTYIRWRFEELNKMSQSSKRKQIYTHLTCAMDKANIKNVFNDVKHIVITTNLFNEGLS